MNFDSALSRKQVLQSFALGLVAAGLPAAAFAQDVPAAPKPDEITLEDIKAAERMFGLAFSDDERKEILASVRSSRAGFEATRKTPIRETSEVPLAYVPFATGAKEAGKVRVQVARVRDLKRPARDEDLAFLSVREMGHLLRTRQVTSVELTRLYLSRLKQYGDALLCLIALTEDLAIQQAEEADRDLTSGVDRGPLHGIPYGAKDLFATKGIPTTWGADPFKAQLFDYDCAAVERLRAAGAVLVAKLSMGSLAQGDVWFNGMTKNPWNPKQGSSGSSAGSAAATAAGLIAFGIGTETSGSILSPSLRCRITGLRPTFGRVSRYGAMELCFSLDRVGPLCRQAEDCALVLGVLCGADPRDPSSVDRPLEYPPRLDLHKLKIAWIGTAASMDADPAVKRFRDLGATVSSAKFTAFPGELFAILNAEAASAFDAFTRGDAIHGLKNSSWPETFRAARFVPAVEYLQAQRARSLMTRQFDHEFGDFDLILGTGIGGAAFSQANFSGYPAMVIPMGDDGSGNSVGRSLVARPYEEAKLVAAGKALQDGFDFHLRHPALG